MLLIPRARSRRERDGGRCRRSVLESASWDSELPGTAPLQSARASVARIGWGFPHAQQQSKAEERGKTLRDGGSRREDGPPTCRGRVHQASSEAVHHVASDQLKDGVGPKETAEYQSQLEVVETKIILDVWGGYA